MAWSLLSHLTPENLVGFGDLFPTTKIVQLKGQHFPEAELGGSQILFLRNASQLQSEGVVGYQCVHLSSPRSGDSECLGQAAPCELHAGAATQPSVLLNNSCMRGVAKGWESWIRNSCWVCWALMLRSSVRTAMIFRNRNLEAAREEGGVSGHPSSSHHTDPAHNSPVRMLGIPSACT